jgi:hypothetical protein
MATLNGSVTRGKPLRAFLTGRIHMLSVSASLRLIKGYSKEKHQQVASKKTPESKSMSLVNPMP